MSLLTRDEKIQELLPSSDSCAAGHEPSRYRPGRPHKTRPRLTWLISGLVVTLLTFSWLLRSPLTRGIGFITRKHGGHHDATDSQVVRRYNLTVGARWLNLDGGFWRGVYVCNGEAPCPTLLAEEGDVVELNVHNDLFGQVSIHWSGMGHRKFGFWNDGTGGLNQYGLLQRGNFTSRYDTSGHWGLNWYADHTGVGIIDGAHGLAYIAPSPSRPRPYHFITASAAELELIKQAERDAQHLLLWNYYRRDVNWRVLEMRSEGTNLNCYDSILVNAKGRRHCRHPDYHTLNGKKLDESGCAIEEGNEGVPCSPTDADYEIVETHGRPWIMLNVLNIGFEHAVQFSIDDHKLWVVANDNGFVRPQLVDVLYVTNGARYTVLIKLDREGADYAMRYVSTSTHQNLEGYSILRYPVRVAALRPAGRLHPPGMQYHDRSVPGAVPPAPPPRANRTLHFRIAQQPSQYEEHVTECFLNQRPWQLYHAQMAPLLFTDDVSAVEPPVVGGLPWGTTVDVIVQNTVDEVMPLYKHGDPMFLLGSAANATWEWDTVESAIKVGVKRLDLKTPAAQLVHDVPPLGWAVLRWQIRVRGATMLHSNKFKYYAMGMSAPLLEGMDSSMQAEVPKGAKAMPHVEFEPKNDGVFG